LKGKAFVKGDVTPYQYSNTQEAATIWYHDHALGITRLNVYAGLAGITWSLITMKSICRIPEAARLSL
jgi:hypothetical protein